VGIILFALVSYNLVKKGIGFYGSGETSMTLRIPMYPVVFVLAFCFFVQCFSFITDIFRIFDTGETT
jgi:TRAP-type C4-dicarboxylate transport system permease small subunit